MRTEAWAKKANATINRLHRERAALEILVAEIDMALEGTDHENIVRELKYELMTPVGRDILRRLRERGK